MNDDNNTETTRPYQAFRCAGCGGEIILSDNATYKIVRQGPKSRELKYRDIEPYDNHECRCGRVVHCPDRLWDDGTITSCWEHEDHGPYKLYNRYLVKRTNRLRPGVPKFY
jgi:hypothetical protein